MNDEDLLGTKALGRATEKTVDGVGTFLGKICMPVAEELGLFLQDHVRAWRAHNAIEIEKKAIKLSSSNGGIKDKSVHPLLAWKIIENGSFSDTEELQKLWAGLLVSSCDFEPDDSNHIFIDILNQLSIIQIRLIEFGSLNASKYHTKNKLIQAEELILPLDRIFEICNSDDLHRIDRELDRLRAIGLISSLGPSA